MANKSKANLKAHPASSSATGSTRRSLVTWAMTGVRTEELHKLKGLGETICKMVQRLRQEKLFAGFEIERLKKDNDGIYEGNRRWREEAQKQARIVAVLEAFINAEMKMTAKDPRIKRLARLIAKASNVEVSGGEPLTQHKTKAATRHPLN
jgi:hypothetical protein